MKISYSKRETKNLGNFESISVEIKVEDEVNFESETVDECYLRLEKFVNMKLATQFSKDKIMATVTAKLNNQEQINPESTRQLIKKIIACKPDNKAKVIELAKSLNIENNLDNVDKKILVQFHQKLMERAI